jgi:hypothetical protein
MRVFVYAEQSDGTLKRVRVVDVADTSTQPEMDAWRIVSRATDLGAGTFQLMRAGRRARLDSSLVYQATDLGVVT